MVSEVYYRHRKSTWELVICLSQPTPDEITALRRWPARLGLAEIDGCAFVLWAFGRLDGEAPYQWHRTRPEERTMPEPLRAGHRIAVEVIAIDASTGLVRAIRLVTASARISTMLTDLVRRQAAGVMRADDDQRRARAMMNFQTRDLQQIGIIDRAGRDDEDTSTKG